MAAADEAATFCRLCLFACHYQSFLSSPSSSCRFCLFACHCRCEFGLGPSICRTAAGSYPRLTSRWYSECQFADGLSPRGRRPLPQPFSRSSFLLGHERTAETDDAFDLPSGLLAGAGHVLRPVSQLTSWFGGGEGVRGGGGGGEGVRGGGGGRNFIFRW